MHRSTALKSTYASDPGWRRIQALLPERLRLEASNTPTEEWLPLGAFSVHLDCWRRSDAPATLILVHGAGGNGRLLAPYGVWAAAAGYEVVAPDLPGHGLTEVPRKRALVYEDWRNTLAGVLEAEARRTKRPIIVFGLSMGGMLAYDATARTGIPKGLVATCFVDPRDPAILSSTTRWPWIASLVPAMLSAVPVLTDPLPLSIHMLGKMNGIANDPALVQAIVSDPRAGGTWMPAGFWRTFINVSSVVEPEAFDVCPVLLVHPADDRWTDVSVTLPFFKRLRVPKRLVMLDNAGHFPVEEPGATQLRTALLGFLAEQSS